MPCMTTVWHYGTHSRKTEYWSSSQDYFISSASEPDPKGTSVNLSSEALLGYLSVSPLFSQVVLKQTKCHHSWHQFPLTRQCQHEGLFSLNQPCRLSLLGPELHKQEKERMLSPLPFGPLTGTKSWFIKLQPDQLLCLLGLGLKRCLEVI